MLTEVNGKTTVVVVLDNDPATVPHPTNINFGSCPTPGKIKYTLNNVISNRSETKIDATLDQIKSLLPMAIVVNKSAIEPQTILSCGDLK